MAILLEQASNATIFLNTLHVFGHDASHANTLLIDRYASHIHASIRWNGTTWELLDHSRHGTFLNQQQIPANTAIPLQLGQTIRFAPNATQTYLVTNLDAPGPMLFPFEHTAQPISLQKFNLLPDKNAPEASIYQDENAQWIWDAQNQTKYLYDNELLFFAGQFWRFIYKPNIDTTLELNELAAPAAPTIYFKFSASQNEEHIQLSISINDKLIDLCERSHHYSLLLLARQRLADAQAGYDLSSQGWLRVAQCAKMLGIDEKHLNMLLHRAREQIAKAIAHYPLYSLCIERRRGEIRFGNFGFQIIRGMHLEAEVAQLPETCSPRA